MYLENIKHLIIGRFYDAEERAERLFNEGRINQQEAVDFIVFISKAKVSFYDAKTKTERVKVIQSVIDGWTKLVAKTKSN